MAKKAKVIVCGLQKGGVGKSSIVRNLSFSLFQRGNRVCMIDFDPQSNLTMSCGIDNPDEIPITIAHLMECELNGRELPDKEDYIRSSDGVDFIPSCKYLSAIETEMRTEMGCERILNDIVVQIQEDYEYILIDIGPTEGILSANALSASDGILIPMDLQLFAMAGVSQILTTVVKLRRRVNSNLQIIGIVFNRYDTRTNLSQQIIDDVTVTYGEQIHLFQATIPQTVYIGESHYHGKPVCLHKPMCGAATSFNRLAEEFMQQCPVERDGDA
jgi:chromosome partitioning protein